MKDSGQKNRRQFLKNTALTALTVGSVPNILKSGTSNNRKNVLQIDCNITTQDLFGVGPFYTENPPTLYNARLANENEPGTRMIITGRVFDLDCSKFIPETIVDVWHANDAGVYDNEGYNLRGQMLTNEQGFYIYETIKPGKYLNGNNFRPSHIHYKITPPGFPTLTTQLYFEGDAEHETDAASSLSSGQFDATNRIIPLTTGPDGVLEGTFNIIMNGNGITSVNDIHLDKGMVYHVSPNPFTDQLTIKYGVFKRSKVSLLVFDLNGKLIANLDERILSPDKYEAKWQPDNELLNGHYFVALKINDLQVHYMKVILQK